MRTLLLVLMAAAFSGCAIKPVHLAQISAENRIGPGDAIGVRLTPESASRVEGVTFVRTASRDQIHTGEVWARVFCGYRADQPILEIRSSELRMTAAAAGFAMRYTYTAKAALITADGEVIISAVGSRATATAMYAAMREAVELAAVDASRQVRAIIAANSSGP